MKWSELKILIEEILKEWRDITSDVKESVDGVKPELFVQGEFFKDEGFANYALFSDKWYSVNGGPDMVTDVRWKVEDPKKIRFLMQMSGRLNEDHGLGYGHNVSFDITAKERDPLNDPRLTGKKPFKESADGRIVHDGGYTFRIFSELAKGDGFDYPVDVKRGTIYLGTLMVMNNGYIVKTIDTPNGIVSYTDLPPYKTPLRAAQVLHILWAAYRKN